MLQDISLIKMCWFKRCRDTYNKRLQLSYNYWMVATKWTGSPIIRKWMGPGWDALQSLLYSLLTQLWYQGECSHIYRNHVSNFNSLTTPIRYFLEVVPFGNIEKKNGWSILCFSLLHSYLSFLFSQQALYEVGRAEGVLREPWLAYSHSFRWRRCEGIKPDSPD